MLQVDLSFRRQHGEKGLDLNEAVYSHQFSVINQRMGEKRGFEKVTSTHLSSANLIRKRPVALRDPC